MCDQQKLHFLIIEAVILAIQLCGENALCVMSNASLIGYNVILRECFTIFE